MRLNFHTNLDEAKPDVDALADRLLDTAHFPIPRKGELVRFCFDKTKHFELEVVAVSHDYFAEPRTVHVELHMPSWQRTMSVAEWTAWFRRHRLGRDY